MQWVHAGVRKRCSRRLTRTVRWSAVLGAMGLAACAGVTKESPAEDKVTAVTERANARWQAMLKRDFDAAYAYLSPSSRAVTPLPTFKARASRTAFREAKIDGVSCESEVCKVKLTVTYNHRAMKGIATPLEETWIIDQGQVWYVWQP